MNQLGIIYADKGDVDQVIALYNQSLEISDRIGDVQGKVTTLHNQGLSTPTKGMWIKRSHSTISLWK
ncbi:tetratricopeptide repeat protein [Nostoc sp.]|uniref:tetratricopeptide repeat protein n=1 Tax=Nostoc sp. TaxID=1180 RepID=UPI002FFB2403